MARCLKCGAIVGSDSRFCPSCGNEILSQKEAAENNVHTVVGRLAIQCPHCGAKMEVESDRKEAFCTYCGGKMLINAAPVVVAVDNKNDINDKINNKRSTDNKKVAENSKTSKTNKKTVNTKTNKKKDFSEIAAIIIVGIFVCVSLIYLGTHGGKSDTPTKDNSNAGKIQVGISASNCTGKNFKEVIRNLKSAGFTNIKKDVIADVVFGLITSDGEVEKVTINGKSSFSSSDWFSPDDQVVVTFHARNSEEATVDYELFYEMTDAQKDAASGTYLGENGSVLVLFHDGKAGYFYKDYDKMETDGEWIFEGDRLYCHLPSVMCSVFVDIVNLDTSSILLKSNSVFWDNEWYTKNSTDEKTLSKEECMSLISSKGVNTVAIPTSEPTNEPTQAVAQDPTSAPTDIPTMEPTPTMEPVPTSVPRVYIYDTAIKRELTEYTIYILLDFDKKEFVYFLVDKGYLDIGAEHGTLSGDLRTGVAITFSTGGTYKLDFSKAPKVVLIDDDGFDYECVVTDVNDAEEYTRQSYYHLID